MPRPLMLHVVCYSYSVPYLPLISSGCYYFPIGRVAVLLGSFNPINVSLGYLLASNLVDLGSYDVTGRTLCAPLCTCYFAGQSSPFNSPIVKNRFGP